MPDQGDGASRKYVNETSSRRPGPALALSDSLRKSDISGECRSYQGSQNSHLFIVLKFFSRTVMNNSLVKNLRFCFVCFFKFWEWVILCTHTHKTS